MGAKGNFWLSGFRGFLGFIKGINFFRGSLNFLWGMGTIKFSFAKYGLNVFLKSNSLFFFGSVYGTKAWQFYKPRFWLLYWSTPSTWGGDFFFGLSQEGFSFRPSGEILQFCSTFLFWWRNFEKEHDYLNYFSEWLRLKIQ